MGREPIGLYIFRFVVGAGILFFMGMLYWSSLLVEEDLKSVLSSVQEMKGDIVHLKTDLSKFKSAQVYASSSEMKSEKNSTIGSQGLYEDSFEERPHVDPSLPNLLQVDHFYKNTLPKLLPPHFKPAGIRQTAMMGKPDTLHPFANLAPYTTLVSQCQLQLATLEFGKYETLAPYLAIKMEERKAVGESGVEYWIHLRDGVYWQPLKAEHFPEDVELAPMFFEKHQVTAHDVKFFVDAMLNPFVQEPKAVAMRNYFGDIEEVRVIDDLTLVIRWKAQLVTGTDGKPTSKIKYTAKWLTGGLQPLPRFVYQYFSDGKKILDEDSDPETYRTNSVWAQQFSRHWARQIIVGCGPWIFDGRTEKMIRFVRNPDHFNPLEVLVEAMEVQFKDSPDAVWLDFKSLQSDTYVLGSSKQLDLQNFLNSPDYQEQLKIGKGIQKLEYLENMYAYVGWNQATPYFNDKRVRQSMTLAIDVNRMIAQNLNGMAVPTTGTFAIDSSAYDLSLEAWPYDPNEAKRLMEEAGWYDSDGSGVRDKIIDGKKVKFSFSLSYYVKNPVSKVNCEYISTALKEIGVDCRLKGLDVADLMHDIDSKDFDAIFFAWALGTPPEEPKQLWHSSGAKEKGSSNVVGFSNPEADRIIEALVYEANPKRRQELYHQFSAILYEEQPYTFLFVPKNTLLYRDYVKNVFIPSKRQDLIPGADVSQPDIGVTWLFPPNKD